MNLKRIGVVGFLLVSTISFLKAQVGFYDLTYRSGIDNVGSNHGISFGDFNNDGLEDIYVSVREAGIPNKLYINRGDLFFEEIGEAAGVNSTGVTTSATWGDINNDGLLDLFIGNTDSPNVLYLNNGDLTFQDITTSAGVGAVFDPRSVNFADVDNDGFLDIYVHNYNTENLLYKNNQDNTFTDVSVESGALNIAPAMGTVFFDMDDDGDQDLYILNDGGNAVLFENDGTGKFEDVTEEAGVGVFCACMGVDIADYDLDGDWDIYISNYGNNYLLENNGNGTFTDKGLDFDVDDIGMGWGTFWIDYDNDGYQDIYLANHEFISSRPNMLYRNNEGESFVWISQGSNIESPYASFGTAAADVNNDGNLDIVVANWGTTVKNQLFVNDNQGRNSILVKAIGTTSNTSAIGAVVKVKIGDKVQMDQISGATGYSSQSSMILHFGVDEAQTIDELMIKWPSGIVETYTDLPVNKKFTLTESSGYTEQALETPVITSINDETQQIGQNYPNPFVESTFIPVSPNNVNDSSLKIYSINGELIRTFVKPNQLGEEPGFIWNATNGDGAKVSPGIYLYRVFNERSGMYSTGKMLLVK